MELIKTAKGINDLPFLPFKKNIFIDQIMVKRHRCHSKLLKSSFI